MYCQMSRGISSPSISTTGLAPLIPALRDVGAETDRLVEYCASTGLRATSPGNRQRQEHHRHGVIGVGAVVGGGDGLTRDAAASIRARARRHMTTPGRDTRRREWYWASASASWIGRRNPADLRAPTDAGQGRAVGHQLAAQIGGHADLVAS